MPHLHSRPYSILKNESARLSSPKDTNVDYQDERRIRKRDLPGIRESIRLAVTQADLMIDRRVGHHSPVERLPVRSE